MTFTPACDSTVAIPDPMPEAAPVTNAVFPAKTFIAFPRKWPRRTGPH
jgi:hypothetical protein